MREIILRTFSTGFLMLFIGGIAAAQDSIDSATHHAVGPNPDTAAVGDFDGDMDLDIAVACDTSDEVSVFFNSGSGTLAPPLHILLPGGSSPQYLLAGDFDGDLDLDLAVSLKGTDSVQLLMNNGLGTFALGGSFGLGQEPRHMAAGNLDGNGTLNRVTSRDVSSLNGNGTGLYGAPTLLGVGSAKGHLVTASGQLTRVYGPPPRAAKSTPFAQTIYVDTSNDVVDFGGAQQVADLPGPDGKVSLPEAGLASDNTPGVQTIGFHIPQSEWLYQQFFPGRAVLKPFLGFRVFDTAILDATTQTAFTGDTNPNGGEVVIWAETYLIDNVGGRMFGFDNSSIHLSGGSNNVIQSNTMSGIEVFDSASNLIGGANPGEGNTGGFVQIDRASDNVVVGNTVNRVRVLGWVGGGKPATNNRIGGPTLGERNFVMGLGTWSSEGFPGGFAIQLFDSIGTIIENNWIGTTPDGLSQGHLATTSGVLFEGENHNTIICSNRIAGILGHGIGPHYAGWLVGSAIQVYGTGGDVSIVGNAIGLNANDEPVLGSVTGIATVNYYLGPVQNVVIGGSASGDGNEIAGHLDSGISVANTFSGVFISGNSIHDNGGLGIDLITDGFQTGVTPNDPLDVDTGGNGLQNFPVLQSAASGGATLHVVGTLNSSPSSSFTIEFFASPQCDPSGFGEGQDYLGSTTVATDSSGDAAFDVILPAAVPSNWFVTSTATHTPSASTSEFSACVEVKG